MHLTITGRNMEITTALKEHAEEKVNKVEKYLKKITSAHIILSVEKYRHIAEVTIHAHGLTLKGMDETADMYTSIDKAMDKIEKQAKKLKDKIQDKGKTVHATDSAPNTESVASKWSKEHLSKIVRTDAFDPKPMSVEEAAMQLQMKDDLFLVFLETRTESINVLYRRKNGDFGLIETT